MRTPQLLERCRTIATLRSPAQLHASVGDRDVVLGDDEVRGARVVILGLEVTDERLEGCTELAGLEEDSRSRTPGDDVVERLE